MNEIYKSSATKKREEALDLKMRLSYVGNTRIRYENEAVLALVAARLHTQYMIARGYKI